MFGLLNRKKEITSPDYFPFKTDIHSHILPGIDDGAPEVETSLELIRALMSKGVQRSIATPHIISDLYPNNSTTINNALKILQDALAENNIDFKVRAAAEYMMDSYFMDLLERKEKLLTISENYILTEFSFATMPAYIKEMTFAVFTEGYQPILAHPERYSYGNRNYNLYHDWLDFGFKLQVNILSLTGAYGKDVAKAAIYLLKNDMVSFVGTDMHHTQHAAALTDPRNIKIFQEHLKGDNWNSIFDFS